MREVLEGGKAQRVEVLESRTDGMAVRMLFERVWGIGPQKASDLFRKGHRTLEDLGGADLNSMQRAGLKYLEDIEQVCGLGYGV